MNNNNIGIKRVRAIIIKNHSILLIHRIKIDTSYWVIPGGKVEYGESHENAIKRECIEELGVTVNVQGIFADKISDKPGMEGHHEFFYLCTIVKGRVGSGSGPEFKERSNYKGKYIIDWVRLHSLPFVNLKPVEIRDKIIKEYL